MTGARKSTQPIEELQFGTLGKATGQRRVGSQLGLLKVKDRSVCHHTQQLPTNGAGTEENRGWTG